MRIRFAERSTLPGFGPALGFTVFYLSLLVLLPLSGLFLRAAGLGWDQFWRTVLSPRALASYRLSFGAALAGGAINAVFGCLVAWVLVRYRFPGSRIVDALVDLPFALPTAVAGIALTTAYAANGPLGRILAKAGIQAAFTPLGVVIAVSFIGLPFVVRTVQPVLEDLDREVEEAALTLGAGPLATAWAIAREARFTLGAAVVVSFGRVFSEVGAAMIVGGNLRGETRTLTTAVALATSQGQFELAIALGLVLSVITLLVLTFAKLMLLRLQQQAGR